MGFVNPKTILDKINLSSSMTAADLGCGSGGWAIPLAKILDEGRVYAVDIQGEALSALKAKAKTENVQNLQKIKANVEEKVYDISSSVCNFVLIANILFEVDDKPALFEEAKRILTPDGRVLIVEWKKNASLGPKNKRVSEKEIKAIARNCGFEIKREIDAGDYHWGLLLEKQ